MIHVGDITKLNGATLEPVNCITGGSPCQDLSIAGKREGLAGERSGLFLEMIRIIREMRQEDKKNGRSGNNVRPRFVIWENVPGAFTSNGGEDFRCVLEQFSRIADETVTIPRPANGKWQPAGCIVGDHWSIAWRTFDAQYWGVPQRRKRIGLVADFGGQCAAEILFEREGVSGDITESGKEGEGAASDAGAGIEKTSRTISFQERAGKPGGAEAETARTLDLNGGSPACNQGGMAVVQASGVVSKGNGDCFVTPEKHMSLSVGGGQAGQGYPCVCIEVNGSRPSHKGDGYAETDTTYTLNSTEKHAVAYRKKGHPQNAEQGQGWEKTETNDTLNAFDNGESRTPTVVLENHPQNARGNGDGNTVPTMTGGHEATISDYTAIVLNDQGGQQMSVSENVTATLRAAEHQHQPIIMENNK